MLSYDFAKLNILEINEEKKIFLQSLREFCTCAEFSIFNSLNAKINSLQFLEFLFIKEVFLKLKPLMGSSDLMAS